MCICCQVSPININYYDSSRSRVCDSLLCSHLSVVYGERPVLVLVVALEYQLNEVCRGLLL